MSETLDITERAIIGAVISRGPHIMDDVELEPTDFYNPQCEFVYRLAMDRHSCGEPVDTLAIDAALRANPDAHGMDFSWLHRNVELNTSYNNVYEYARIVRDEAARRRVKAAATRVMQAANDGTDPDELVDLGRREMERAGRIANDELVPLHSSMLDTLEEIENPVRGVLTPWADLNSLIGGLVPGRLYVVGARPGVGKSAWALQAALALAEKGFVSFVSLEMGRSEINKRIISHDLKIDMENIMSGTLSPAHWERVHRHMDVWSQSKLIVNDNPGVTLSGIRKHARTVAKRGELTGIVVDYLQLLSAPQGDQRKRHEVVAEFSRNLKLLARDLNVAVIALSQLNRESAGRSDHKPKITDLRESGAVEQDADVVILLHRELLGDTKYELTMSVAKNRQGRTGDVEADFYGQYSEIRSKHAPGYSQDRERSW